MHVSLDGNSLTPPGGWLVRRAPGHVEYHYQQLLSFTVEPNYPELPLNGEPFPWGFVFQLQLLSSWGDPYYMGLNELEVYDATGRVIPLTIESILTSVDVCKRFTGPILENISLCLYQCSSFGPNAIIQTLQHILIVLTSCLVYRVTFELLTSSLMGYEVLKMLGTCG